MKVESLITIIISSGALLFSFLNYRRNSRIDNENHLYKLKMDIYSKILFELGELIEKIDEHYLDLKDYSEGEISLSKEEILEMEEELEDVCYAFNNFITANSLVLPKDIIATLEKLCDDTIKKQFEINYQKLNHQALQHLNNLTDDLINKANSINELMRKDLQIEKLNILLYKRLK